MDSMKIFMLIIGNAIYFILSLIFFYSIRLIFDIEIIGYLGTFLSFFTVISFINDFGLHLAYLKFFAGSENTDKEELCNGAFLSFRVIQLAIYIFSALILIPLIPIYPGDIFVVYIFFLSTLFLRISFFDQVLFTKKEVVKKSLSSILYLLIKTILLIILSIFYQKNLWLLINIILISNIAYFIINCFFIRKRKFKKPTKELMKEFLRYSYPFFLTNTLYFIVNNIDILLINSWSNIDNVANYFTAKQFLSFFLFIFTSISYILITTFSKNISEGKGINNIEIINYSHKMLNLLIVPMIFMIFLFATDALIFIFGEEYRLTGQILNLFMLLLIPLSLDSVNIVQLQALGEIRFIAKFTIIENLLSILFMVLFISPNIFNLDVYGGVFSFILSKFIIQLIYRPILYKKFNLGFYWGFFRNMTIMTGIFIAQLWINNLIVYPIYIIPLFISVDILVYFLINYILKGFSKQDFKFIFKIINIKNIYDSVAIELKKEEEI